MPKIIVNEKICKGCEICVHVCPKKIIAISESKMNEKGYRPAQLTDESACTGCCACATMCPDVAIVVER